MVRTTQLPRGRSICSQFPTLAFNTRRVVLNRFPYLVVFRETTSEIEVVAVAHGRRRPGYWRERLSGTSH